MSATPIDDLQHPDGAVRRAACAAVARDPSATLWLDGLLAALDDPDTGVARAASHALVRIGRSDRTVEPMLKRSLHAESPGIRIGSAFSLARMAPPHPGLLPALVEALEARDGAVRWTAARLIVDVGRAHPEVLRLVIGLASDLDRGRGASVRRMATFCLRELGPDLPEVAQALEDASRDPDPPVRRAALSGLAALIEPAPRVAERLIEAIESDPDAASRGLAAAALGALAARQPEVRARAIPALRRLRDADGAEEPALRRAAERALAPVEEPTHPSATRP